VDRLAFIESKLLCFGRTESSVFVANAKVRLALYGLVNAFACFDFDHCNFCGASISDGELEHSERVTHRGHREIARRLPPVVLEMRDTPEILDPSPMKAKSYEATFSVGKAHQQVSKRTSVDTRTDPFEPLVLVSGG
jgi:hypothetical protein